MDLIKKIFIFSSISILAFLFTGCDNSSSSSENTVLEIGAIEVYSDSDHNTYRTTNDELYNRNLLTASHKNLTYGTYIKITNLLNGYRTIVKINDHALSENCIIKVSHEAAKQLGIATEIPASTTVSLELSSGQ